MLIGCGDLKTTYQRISYQSRASEDVKVQNVRVQDVHVQTDTSPLHRRTLQSRTPAQDQQGQGLAAPAESPVSQDRPSAGPLPSTDRRHRLHRVPGRGRSSGAMFEAQNSNIALPICRDAALTAVESGRCSYLALTLCSYCPITASHMVPTAPPGRYAQRHLSAPTAAPTAAPTITHSGTRQQPQPLPRPSI